MLPIEHVPTPDNVSGYAIELRFDPEDETWWMKLDTFIPELRGIEKEATRRAQEEFDKEDGDEHAFIHLNAMASTIRQVADGMSLALAEASTEWDEEIRQRREEKEPE